MNLLQHVKKETHWYPCSSWWLYHKIFEKDFQLYDCELYCQ